MISSTNRDKLIPLLLAMANKRQSAPKKPTATTRATNQETAPTCPASHLNSKIPSSSTTTGKIASDQLAQVKLISKAFLFLSAPGLR